MNKQALIAATIAMLAWGAAAICDKFGMRGGHVSPLAGLMIRLTVATVAVWAFGLVSGILPEIRAVSTIAPANLLGLAGGGLLAALVGQQAYYAALRYADASRVVPFTASYPVIAMVLAVTILKEPLTLAKVVGTLMIIGGLMLVSGIFGGK